MKHEESGGLKAHIIKIIPVSVYQEKIYAQDIIVELDDGTKLALDDSKKLCKEDLLGKVKYLEVLIYVAGLIEKNDKKELKIVPVSINQNQYQGPYAEICGYIENIIVPADKKKIEDIPHAVLNIGVGKLNIFLAKEYLKILRKGDYIKLKGARLDLKAIEPM